MRRRQRSVRVTVAVSLLSLTTLVVLASLPTQSVLWLSLASVTGLALSWAALRITWAEVLLSRRENAADRAAAATAYRDLFTVRAAEHAEFTTAMTERLALAHISQRELEGLVTQHQTRATRAESKVGLLTETLAESKHRVRALEETVAALHNEHGEDAVFGLGAWEEQTGQKTAAKAAKNRPALKQA